VGEGWFIGLSGFILENRENVGKAAAAFGAAARPLDTGLP